MRKTIAILSIFFIITSFTKNKESRFNDFAIKSSIDFISIEVGVKSDTIYFSLSNDKPRTQIMIDTSMIEILYGKKSISIIHLDPPSCFHTPELLLLNYGSNYIFKQKVDEEYKGPIQEIGLRMNLGYKDSYMFEDSINTMRVISLSAFNPTLD